MATHGCCTCVEQTNPHTTFFYSSTIDTLLSIWYLNAYRVVHLAALRFNRQVSTPSPNHGKDMDVLRRAHSLGRREGMLTSGLVLLKHGTIGRSRLFWITQKLIHEAVTVKHGTLTCRTSRRLSMHCTLRILAIVLHHHHQHQHHYQPSSQVHIHLTTVAH